MSATCTSKLHQGHIIIGAFIAKLAHYLGYDPDTDDTPPVPMFVIRRATFLSIGCIRQEENGYVLIEHAPQQQPPEGAPHKDKDMQDSLSTIQSSAASVLVASFACF